MNRNAINLFFVLLRSAVCNSLLKEEEKSLYNNEVISLITTIAKKHDISHLIAQGLKNNGLIVESNKHYETEIFKAVYRYENQKYVYDNLCEALEKARIPFLPLKGSVIRKYYPEPWMRTSCDIDVLIKECDIQKATTVLTESCGFECKGKGSHDVSFFSPNKTLIELHYSLIEDDYLKKVSNILKNVWNEVTVSEKYTCGYEASNEFLYFYHLAHMAKHFVFGGCGIRSFIDLWMLNRHIALDKEKLNEMLNEGGLSAFAEQTDFLCKVWFEEKEHTETSKQIEELVLRGGTYGNIENLVVVQQQKKGGKIKYVFKKIFLPYNKLKYQYPVLQKHKWLTPVMQVVRWGRLIFCGHSKRVRKELKQNSSVSKDVAEKTRSLIDKLGL